jgi:pimeloyl-ACP methyl ester carboxylesterase
MPKARVNGVELRYEVAGKGYPLAFVHAYPLTLEMWAPQVAYLSRNFRVVTYDARGFGQSEAPQPPEAYSQETAVEDLFQLMKHLGIKQGCVIGASMGGNIALHLALRHPEILHGVVVADTGAGSDDPKAFHRMVEEWAKAADAGGIEKFADLILAHPIFAEYAARGPEAERQMRGMIASNTARGVANTARRVLGRRPPIYDLEARLVKMALPALVMVGENDEACFPPSKFMAEKIPEGDLRIVQDAGHLPNLERPDVFNDAVERFVNAASGAE